VYVVLARLYTLGDRLLASSFKRTVLADFTANLAYASLPEWCVCQLLEVVAQELPGFLLRDPLREHVLWYATSHLEQLQRYNGFDPCLSSSRIWVAGSVAGLEIRGVRSRAKYSWSRASRDLRSTRCLWRKDRK
jgi:hypothetical protein